MFKAGWTCADIPNLNTRMRPKQRVRRVLRKRNVDVLTGLSFRAILRSID